MFKSKLVGAMFKIRRIFNMVSKSPVVVQTQYGRTTILVLKNEVVGQLILAGDYEDQDIRHIMAKIKPNDVFLDVGANVGLFSLMLASEFPTISVHAFEPIPINVALVNLSKLLNGMENIHLNQTCVGDRDGEIEFSVSSDSAFSSIIDTGRVSESMRIKSKIIKLDSYILKQQITHVDIIKIDVEGAEKLVLLGAEKLLSDMKPRLIMMELYDPNFVQFNTSVGKSVV